MLATKGIEWEAEPPCFRRGTFFKRMRRPMPLGQEEIIRFEIGEVDIELKKFNQDINNVLKCEVYPPNKE